MAILMTASLSTASPATASEAATFKGSCTMAGTVTFAPPATLLPGPGTSSADLTGTCSGTLTRGAAAFAVKDARSAYIASASGASMSCGGGTSAGSGRLTVNATPVRFSLREIRVGPIAHLTLRGGTNMTGIVNVDPAAGVEAINACAGPGLSNVAVAGQFLPL